MNRVALVLGGALLAAGCSGGASSPSPSPVQPTPAVTAAPVPMTTPTPVPSLVDDPGTVPIEVAGELLAVQLRDAVGSSEGDVQQSRDGLWRQTAWLSDPRVSGDSEMILDVDFYPDGYGLAWSTSTPSAAWQGISITEIHPDGVHEGAGVYLGTGVDLGLELHIRAYMGPGANTTSGDRLAITGRIERLATPGWAPAEMDENAVRASVAALVGAWGAGDASVAKALYREDAVHLDESETTVGRADIAALVEGAAGDGIGRELRDEVRAFGNYALAPVQVTGTGRPRLEILVLRLDPASGLFTQHEVITP